MPAHWNPFNREEQHVEPEIKPGTETKPPEKTPAQMIAESLAEVLPNALKPITDKIDAVDARLTAATTPKEQPARQDPPTGPPSVLDNEDLAFSTRLTPLLAGQYELSARFARQEVKAEYMAAGWGDVWAANEAEINTCLDGSPLVGGDGKPVRGNPDYIRNVADMVIGRAAKKAGLKFGGGKDGKFFVETAGGESAGPSGPVDDGLTPDQRRVFARMKVGAAEGAKTVASMKAQGFKFIN